MFALKTDESKGAGERRVDCSFCGKHFRSHHYLKMHEKWHKGELEHKCSVCSKAFRFPSELKKHSSIHSGELPYKCDQCGKCFGRMGTLHEHMWVDHQKNMASLKIERRGIYNRHHSKPIKREATLDITEPSLGSYWQNDLFKDISHSEMSLRDNSMSMMSDIQSVDTNQLQDIYYTNDFNQFQNNYGMLINIPDNHILYPNGDDSILGLNPEFHYVRNLRFANQIKSLGEEEHFQDDWREEFSLPTGWKSNSEGHFMSPTGQTFGSWRAVHEFLSRHEATQLVNNEPFSKDKLMDNIEAPNNQIITIDAPNDGGCQKCLLIKEYENKIAKLEHSHN